MPERGSLMQTCATMCYPDLEETNHTVIERLGGRGLSFNRDSYARTFKCLTTLVLPLPQQFRCERFGYLLSHGPPSSAPSSWSFWKTLWISLQLFNATEDPYFFASAVPAIAVWGDNEDMAGIC